MVKFYQTSDKLVEFSSKEVILSQIVEAEEKR